MLADSGGLVGFRQIFAGIAHLLDDPGDIGIAIAVMMIGCLAQEIRRGRHARSSADAHIEAAIKTELLAFWACAIDAERRRVVLSGDARTPVDHTLVAKWGAFACTGLPGHTDGTGLYQPNHAAAP